MKFVLKKDYLNKKPYLESENRLFNIKYSEVSGNFTVSFSGMPKILAKSRNLKNIIEKAEKVLFETIKIDEKTIDYIKKYYNLFAESKSSSEIKKFVKTELMNGTTIKMDISLRKAIIVEPLGRKIIIKGKEFEKYVDEFAENDVSEDQELDFEEYLIYKVLTR